MSKKGGFTLIETIAASAIVAMSAAATVSTVIASQRMQDAAVFYAVAPDLATRLLGEKFAIPDDIHKASSLETRREDVADNDRMWEVYRFSSRGRSMEIALIR